MVHHPRDRSHYRVRVLRPWDLTAAGLRAHKAVFCEFPGATLAEAQRWRPCQGARTQDYCRLAGAQRPDADVRPRSDQRGLHRCRADGEPASSPSRCWSAALAAPGRATARTVPTRSPSPGTPDGPCYVLGEFDALTARLATYQGVEDNGDGPDMSVDAPDTISVAGVLKSGPSVGARGGDPLPPQRYTPEIYAAKGRWHLGALFNIGPSVLYAARGDAPLAERCLYWTSTRSSQTCLPAHHATWRRPTYAPTPFVRGRDSRLTLIWP